MWSFYVWFLNFFAFVCVNGWSNEEEVKVEVVGKNPDQAEPSLAWFNPFLNSLKTSVDDFGPTESSLDETTITPTLKPKKEAGQKCKSKSEWWDASSKKCRIKLRKKIVGGRNAGYAEFPHMAHWGYIYYSTLYKHTVTFCGASLITNKFLLTAAHCGYETGKQHYVAWLGKGTNSEVEVKIVDIIPHWLYNHETTENDIALLRMDRRIYFNDNIRPACIQNSYNIDEDEAIASGWGKTSSSGDHSEQLLKVTLPILSNSQCRRFWPVVDDTMICAGGAYSNKNTCGGDSGGPLQIKRNSQYCSYSIIGLTSFGNEYCSGVGVYTRVSYYTNWIVKNAVPAGQTHYKIVSQDSSATVLYLNPL